jgi:hypothetical protein
MTRPARESHWYSGETPGFAELAERTIGTVNATSEHRQFRVASWPVAPEALS